MNLNTNQPFIIEKYKQQTFLSHPWPLSNFLFTALSAFVFSNIATILFQMLISLKPHIQNSPVFVPLYLVSLER